jgi:hypothetical protein
MPHVRQFCRNPQPSPALTQHLGPPWPQRFPKFSKAIARAGYERPEAWFEPAGRMGVSLEAIPIIPQHYQPKTKGSKTKMKTSWHPQLIPIKNDVNSFQIQKTDTTCSSCRLSFGRLNNLVMIVNCNYQRLDGPVRGNSKAMEMTQTSPLVIEDRPWK